ncbi:hypothetical protein P8452_61489 [Trifolium repens]|nr:hypothetical protein P8452_61489 [Trifolium repens]
MGPETLLSLMPLNLEAEDLSVSNRLLIPILKQYIVGARLKYFTEEILPMIERLQKQGLVVSSRNLWSLLPSFCNYPSDTAKSFEDLEKHLRSKLKEEPDIRGIICTSLQLLIRQNKNVKDSYDKDDIWQDMANEQVLVNYSQQVATENLRALEVYAKNLLKVLSDVFLKSTKDDGGCLQVISPGMGFSNVVTQEDGPEIDGDLSQLTGGAIKSFACNLVRSGAITSCSSWYGMYRCSRHLVLLNYSLSFTRQP